MLIIFYVSVIKFSIKFSSFLDGLSLSKNQAYSNFSPKSRVQNNIFKAYLVLKFE